MGGGANKEQPSTQTTELDGGSRTFQATVLMLAPEVGLPLQLHSTPRFLSPALPHCGPLSLPGTVFPLPDNYDHVNNHGSDYFAFITPQVLLVV